MEITLETMSMSLAADFSIIQAHQVEIAFHHYWTQIYFIHVSSRERTEDAVCIVMIEAIQMVLQVLEMA